MGQLYTASHVRLADGVLRGRPVPEVALGLRVAGLPGPDWKPQGLHPVGRFGRTALFESVNGWTEASSPAGENAPLEVDGCGRYVVVLTAPALVDGDGWRRPGGKLDDHLPGEAVAACTDRPTMIGGWDGIKRRPTGMQPCLPPGCVWFMQAAARDRARVRQLLNGTTVAVGKRTHLGFGECLIGLWPEEGSA